MWSFYCFNRTDVDNAWQFPQGGIDNGESADEALYRELEEEIGTRDVEIIAEYPKWVSYDFPPSIAKKCTLLMVKYKNTIWSN